MRWRVYLLAALASVGLLSWLATGVPFDNPDYYYASITAAPSGTFYRSVGLSPDGTQLIAQKSWKDGAVNRTEIVLLDADGQNEVVISAGDSGTGDIYGYQVPFWSDDGTAVGFVEVHNATANRVLKYQVGAGTTSVVYAPTAGDVSNPDFVGDSTDSIVFWQYGPVGGADLFIWDGAAATNITNTPNYKEYEPVSNADGTVILFWSGETTTEPTNTTHTLTYSGGLWMKDVGFTPIPDTYWPYWTGRSDGLIGLTRMSTKDVELYNGAGTFVMDLTGAGYEGGSSPVTQWNFFGFTGEGPYGEFVITSNALRGVLAGRDIVVAAPREQMHVDQVNGSDAYSGTPVAPFSTIGKGVLEVLPGGTVVVAAGAYSERVTLTRAVTLSGAPGATIDAGGSGNVLGVAANAVTVDGFEIVGGGSSISGETDNSLFQNNVIHDNVNVPGSSGAGILLWGDNDANRIAGNAIYWNDRQGIFIGYQDATKISTGNVIEGNAIYGNGRYTQPNGPDASAYGIQLWYADENEIIGNQISGQDNWFVAPSYDFAQGVYLISSFGNSVTGNVLTGNNYGLCQWNTYDTGRAGGINVLHWNSIAGNTGYGIRNVDAGTAYVIDASLNWWGDASGPSGVGPGAGDAISANVIYSPWLGLDPDGDAGTAGVQITGPVVIVVDDVGPAPAGGYLDAAIGGSNDAMLPYEDAILVMDGDYTASTALTDGVALTSSCGACKTSITGSLAVNTDNTTIGQIREGFTVHGPITVGTGVDAGTIHINWNDIYGSVTNNGTGRLDAAFNYWGADGPETTGIVDTYPILPVSSCVLISYIDEYGLRVMEAITFARLLERGLPVSQARLAAQIVEEYGIDLGDAMALIREYGLGRVRRAFFVSDTLDEFLLQVAGYRRDVAGGGGGVTGDLGSYPVGAAVPLSYALMAPFSEEPASGAIVSYTLVRMIERPGAGSLPIPELIRLGVLAYDADLEVFAATLDTTGLEPGSYQVWIGADDGWSTKYALTLTE